ncbi:MAG: DUF1266 domain-containing protein [Chitinophagales bacterium]
MKWIARLLAMVLVLNLWVGFVQTSPALSAQVVNQKVYINGKILISKQQAYISGDNFFLPFRATFEQLGFKVAWDAKQNAVKATKGSMAISAPNGKPYYIFNGKQYTMDGYVTTYNKTVMIPVWVFQEVLAAGVRWDEALKAYQIYTLSDTSPYTIEQLRRGVAAGAIYDQFNGTIPGLFNGDLWTLNELLTEKKSISESWGITNRETALKILSELKDGKMHNQEFNEFAKVIVPLNDSEFRELLASVDDADTRTACQFVRDHYKETNGKGILAWDLVRQIAVARWCFFCGYITYDETVTNIMDAAIKMQSTFGSYKEMEDNHALGRWYWSLDRTLYDECIKEENWLLTDKDSPWLQLDWKMSMQPKTKV